MSQIRHIKVAADDDGQRLDRWLKKNAPEIPYGLIQKLIRKGQIRIDGKRAKTDTRLTEGQQVKVPNVEERSLTIRPKHEMTDKDAVFIRSLVIYDDGDVIAINKPADLAVQGGSKIKRHVDGMLDALAGKDGVRPRLVHRLDKDTSGVLLLARSAKVAKALGDSFKHRDIKKIYWALVKPTPEVLQGSIKAPVAKGEDGAREKMLVDEDAGKFALTEYCVLEQAGPEIAFVAFWPRTGRTHQIRVHAQVIGCPVLGDFKYGGGEARIDGMAHARRLHLHAHRLILPHPVHKKPLDISAPLPLELEKSWKMFGFSTKHKDDPFADFKV